MSASRATSWSYCEDYRSEDEALLTARYRAEELGCGAVTPGVGSLLTVLAASSGAKAIVEIGTGTGVSGLWLLRGMADGGVLTSIDVSSENQRAAREAFDNSGIKTGKARLITGSATDVLPRLSDHSYDMVFIDADIEEVSSYIMQARRLLRHSGLIVVHSALLSDRVADPAKRDATTTCMREAIHDTRDDDALLSALVPLGDGLLLAVA